MSESSIAKTWELLKPHALPRVPAMGVAVLLGTVTGFAAASSLALVAGIWSLIFPEAPGAGEAELGKVDKVLAGVRAWAERGVVFDSYAMNMLFALAVAAIVLALAAGVSQWGFTLITRKVAYQMVVDLRVQLARHLMALSMQYHGRRRFGDLLSRISSDVTITLVSINLGMKALIQEPILALGVVCVMFAIAPGPTFGILVILPLGMWPVKRLSRRVRKGSKKSLSSLGDSAQALTQMFQGIRTVKSFGGEERELERYRDLNEGYLRSSMRMVRAVALTQSWASFFSIGAFALLALAIGWVQVRFKPFPTGGEMAGWFLMVARLSNNVKSIVKGLAKVEESVGASERILDLLAESNDLVEADDPVPIAGLTGPIRFEGVTFHYPTDDPDVPPAIRDLDLEIRPGETLALVGPSGAGKSTLVDLVARFIDPTAGRITVDGEDLRQLVRDDWTALYAMVSQVPFLFHSSIGENIAYGKPDATQEEIEAAARAADIHEFIAALPEGYATDVSDMGVRLSGGQRQRITIARAILKGAPLLLLDEATSSLDSESEVEVQRALNRLMTDRTVVVIAHRLSTVRNADRIAVLENGRLVEVGTHEELLRRGATYARLYALQSLDTIEYDGAGASVGSRAAAGSGDSGEPGPPGG